MSERRPPEVPDGGPPPYGHPGSPRRPVGVRASRTWPVLLGVALGVVLTLAGLVAVGVAVFFVVGLNGWAANK